MIQVRQVGKSHDFSQSTTKTKRLFLAAVVGAFVQHCASVQRPAPTTVSTQRPVIQGEGFHVIGSVNQPGDAYDAETLFQRANQAARERQWETALVFYSRLLREFPSSSYVLASEFNRGICYFSLQRSLLAIQSFRRVIRETNDPQLRRDALFRLAVVGEHDNQPELVIEATDPLIALTDLPLVDRVEALARRATARLNQNNITDATALAEQVTTAVPNDEAINRLGDDTYVAQARFVLAEIPRRQADEISIDADSADLEQHIERRIQLVLRAHVLFNRVISVGNPEWSAASGYHLGRMYHSLFDAIVNARTPSDWDANAIGIYRRQTSSRLQPLLRGALRSWELTLSMAQREGIGANSWVQRTNQEIDALRDLVYSLANRDHPVFQQH